MEKKEYTYKDFKIGQKVICYSLDREFPPHSSVPDKEFWLDHLTVGKTYKINDVDFHFPEKICVKCDRGGYAFVPIPFFVAELAEEREIKIDDILND